jgi:glycosyltransferase involved in cell wall biosynthesis
MTDHEVIYIYEATESEERLEEMRRYCEVVKNEGQVVECDLCIFSSVFRGAHQIKAKKYIQVVHTEYHKWNIKYKPVEADLHVSVGQAAADSLKQHYGVDSVVIPNMPDIVETKSALNLVTASRIRPKKGFERIIALSKALEDASIPFSWQIYGEGIKSYVEGIKTELSPHVQFCGNRNDIYPYMKAADYVVQLSDNEGYCYSVAEALQVGTPVIVTAWEGVEQLVEDNVNGIVLNMDMTNIDVNKIFSRDMQGTILRVNNSVQLWRELLSNI